MILSFSQTRTLSRIASLLAEPITESTLRRLMGEEVLRLVDGDQYASYIWDDASRAFTGRVTINMSDSNLQSYEHYYQFRDPITLKLQQRRKATLVEQVIEQDSLISTEFFNDFLSKDGLFWGVNMFAWDGSRNIGDMRIWRSRKKGRFDHDCLNLLNLIGPGFTTALKRARMMKTDFSNQITPEDRKPCKVELSRREWDVADLTVQGLSDKEIAARLQISFPTVRTHISHIFQKLDVNSRVQLATKILSCARMPGSSN